MTAIFMVIATALLVLLSVRDPWLGGSSSSRKRCQQPSDGSSSPPWERYDGSAAVAPLDPCQRAYRGGVAHAAAFQPAVLTRTAAGASFRRYPPAFAASFASRVPNLQPTAPASFSLAAAKKSGGGSSSSSTAPLSSSSKRKRKRKQSSPSAAQSPVKESTAAASASPTAIPDPRVVDNIKLEQEPLEGLEVEDTLIDHDDDDDDDDTFDKDDVLLEMKKVAQFEFRPPTDDDEVLGRGSSSSSVAASSASLNEPDMFGSSSSSSRSLSSSSSATSATDGAIPLPDIREARMRKRVEEEMAKMEQEKDENRVKIKRSDKEAFRKLLEQQPFADADDSFFEEEAYDNVSALLGERAKPFLGIPVGPLQVGHFVGALAIVLMAFVEYPGFPLTNLPTPLRDALQGGLGVVYLINAGLAVFAAIQAGERGQPAPLWAAKTLSVGGLALDQLMQLPTLEQVERAKARKGKRAIKNSSSSSSSKRR